MNRDKVIEYAKDWAELMEKWSPFQFELNEDGQERKDVMLACMDLAYNRTKEALIAYTKEREAEFAAHERMLDTIEQTLKEGIKDGG